MKTNCLEIYKRTWEKKSIFKINNSSFWPQSLWFGFKVSLKPDVCLGLTQRVSSSQLSNLSPTILWEDLFMGAPPTLRGRNSAVQASCGGGGGGVKLYHLHTLAVPSLSKTLYLLLQSRTSRPGTGAKKPAGLAESNSAHEAGKACSPNSRLRYQAVQDCRPGMQGQLENRCSGVAGSLTMAFMYPFHFGTIPASALLPPTYTCRVSHAGSTREQGSSAQGSCLMEGGKQRIGFLKG